MASLPEPNTNEKKSDDEVDEKPTCYLRSLNDDCLSKIFEYVGNYEYVQLSRYDDHFNTIIKTMVVKRKLVRFRGCAVDFNKTCFRLFGESLRHIEFYDFGGYRMDNDYFLELFENNPKIGELETLSIINKYSEKGKIRENLLLEMLHYTPNLKTLRYSDRVLDTEMVIAQYCPNIEVLDINYRGDHINYFSNFHNLKCASFISTPKAYEMLKDMAERNKIEKLKMLLLNEFTPNIKLTEEFNSLKSFELCSYKEFNFDLVPDLLPNLKNLEELVVESNLQRNEAIHFFEMVPWIHTYSIRKSDFYQLPAAVRKLVKRICDIKLQQSCNGPIKRLHLILNIRQWREFEAIKNIHHDPFIKVSVKPTDFEIMNNMICPR